MNKQDQVFIKDGRHAYRRRYSAREFQVGIVIILCLLVVALWVRWKGRHVDPSLYSTDLVAVQAASPEVDRGPLPKTLADAGWIENSLSSFDPTNLYVKINGREDYYKSYGFQKLTFLSLALEDDPTTTIDIEFFDLKFAANALGAYAGERSEGVQPTIDGNGMYNRSRNVLFMTRGKYYVRLIGSDESTTILNQLSRLEAILIAEVQGEALPWGYAILAGVLELDPGSVSYMAENAFSFGFANRLYAAGWGSEDTEVFISVAASESEAQALAAEFRAGFLSMGSVIEDANDWVQDRYLSTFSTAIHEGRWVAGVRGAPTTVQGKEALGSLRSALQTLRPDIQQRAFKAADTAAAEAADNEPASADIEEYEDESAR